MNSLAGSIGMQLRRVAAATKYLITRAWGPGVARAVRSVIRLPRYARDYRRFRSRYDGPIRYHPCLSDWDAEGGHARGEYFWQDLWVARKIFERNPDKHVDIGSRVDGFVAHVASFRELEVIDIRPIPVSIPGVIFRTQDITSLAGEFGEYCDSLSCLHALEHIGLGRYGDPVDPAGYQSALRNMARMVRPGGRFYLSVPVGTEMVYFNAHRVFNPEQILKEAAANNLELEEMAVIDAHDMLRVHSPHQVDLHYLASQKYNLGIFVLRKIRGN